MISLPTRFQGRSMGVEDLSKTQLFKEWEITYRYADGRESWHRPRAMVYGSDATLTEEEIVRRNKGSLLGITTAKVVQEGIEHIYQPLNITDTSNLPLGHFRTIDEGRFNMYRLFQGRPEIVMAQLIAEIARTLSPNLIEQYKDPLNVVAIHSEDQDVEGNEFARFVLPARGGRSGLSFHRSTAREKLVGAFPYMIEDSDNGQSVIRLQYGFPVSENAIAAQIRIGKGQGEALVVRDVSAVIARQAELIWRNQQIS